MNLFNLTKTFHEHSDLLWPLRHHGIIAKQQKAYMKRKKEIFKGYTILMTANVDYMKCSEVRTIIS